LLIYQELEYVRTSWERELERREKERLWIAITYDNILRAVNEYLLSHDYGNIIEKFRTKHKYMQKHIDTIVHRIVEFCRRHNLKKIPKQLLNDLIEYEIQRKIILRNYVRNHKVPYKYPR